eukprot:scaffold439_cov415-Prasinococcus_capsulatus_cf.AAC.52
MKTHALSRGADPLALARLGPAYAKIHADSLAQPPPARGPAAGPRSPRRREGPGRGPAERRPGTTSTGVILRLWGRRWGHFGVQRRLAPCPARLALQPPRRGPFRPRRRGRAAAAAPSGGAQGREGPCRQIHADEVATRIFMERRPPAGSAKACPGL